MVSCYLASLHMLGNIPNTTTALQLIRPHKAVPPPLIIIREREKHALEEDVMSMVGPHVGPKAPAVSTLSWLSPSRVASQ